MALPSLADIVPQVGDKLFFSDYQSGQHGGSLLVNPTAGSNFTPFRTFCVELEQVVWVNGGSNFQYQIANIGLTTISGNKTLTDMAAWLYTHYRQGTLAAYNDAALTDRNALQCGIWKAMGYTDTDLKNRFGNGFQTVINAYNARPWANLFNTDQNWSGVGSVRVASLVWGNYHQGGKPGDPAQDQLVMVPVPGAALLGALGLSLIGSLKRRV
jgi:hypothetical protein